MQNGQLLSHVDTDLVRTTPVFPLVIIAIALSRLRQESKQVDKHQPPARSLKHCFLYPNG